MVRIRVPVAYCDMTTLVVGAGLFLSPWLLGFSGPSPHLATQSAATLGAIIAVTSIATLTAFEMWELYILLAAALAAMTASWTLPLERQDAAIAHLLAGTLTFALAAIRFSSMRAKPGVEARQGVSENKPKSQLQAVRPA